MRRTIRFTVSLLVVVLVGGAVFGAVRVSGSRARPVASLSGPATWTPAQGEAAPVSVPAKGSLAVDAIDDEGTRVVTGSDAQTVRPIASVTKTMTALVVLELHPLVGGESGPVLTMTATDTADYTRIAASGGSVAPVHTGERLSERQLLLGLMLPSANNMALTLARWVDGNVAAFVTRLNRRALSLGMQHTSFADPDGLDPATTSTAADLVLLGLTAVANPTLVDIVSTPSATLTDGTVVHNLDELLTTEPGWIGIKTGWTPQAGGCLLFAARRVLAAGTGAITVVGAVLAQPPDASVDPAHPELGSVMRIARSAVETVLAGYATITVTAGALPVSGTLDDNAGHPLTMTHSSGADHVAVLRIGEALRLTMTTTDLAEPVAAGTSIGSVTVSRDGMAVGTWQVVTDTGVAEVSVIDRLLHW